MIAVIADDLTGAAELAGIGLRYNLSVELAMTEQTNAKTDLLIICTDSRSMTKSAAQRVNGDAMKKIISVSPTLIYKKTDSVLRGHILDELKIQMLVAGKQKALIIAANPSFGRTIKDGHYFIDEKPVAQTGFADDPEFAVKDSSVIKMLKAKPGEVMVLKHEDELPSEGIVIGEAATTDDVKRWADKAGDSWLLAGAGDFFTALIEKQYDAQTQPEIVIGSPHLYGSGTAFDKRQEFIKEADKKLGCVIYLPAGSTGDGAWINEVMSILEKQDRAIIAIDKEEIIPKNISALSIRKSMAKAVRAIVENAGIRELFIEGGSTAAAVLKELGIKKLQPVNELQRGMVRMKANEMYITVKPGSYELPDQIAKLYLLK
jgi:D-threonate/D-erythronate kinase